MVDSSLAKETFWKLRSGFLLKDYQMGDMRMIMQTEPVVVAAGCTFRIQKEKKRVTHMVIQ